MSGEIRTITVTVTTRDVEHWKPETRAAAEATPLGYHDWITEELVRLLVDAGARFAAKYPDVLRTEPDVV